MSAVSRSGDEEATEAPDYPHGEPPTRVNCHPRWFCAPGTRVLRRREARKLTSLCARRAPTIKPWSLDARSGNYASPLAENGSSTSILRPQLEQHGALPMAGGAP